MGLAIICDAVVARTLAFRLDNKADFQMVSTARNERKCFQIDLDLKLQIIDVAFPIDEAVYSNQLSSFEILNAAS